MSWIGGPQKLQCLWDFEASLDQLDDRTPCRTESVVVDQGSVDVVVPMTGTEAEAAPSATT